ncbi:MAG: hypothetical protein ACI84K_001938 [Pseudohongiellaceae bacterium]|jgi:uncharacterized protein (TIGR03643 family)
MLTFFIITRSVFMISKDLAEADISRIIEMAWEDRTPFEVIAEQYQLSEPQVIRLMRTHMKASSFRMWRKRVSGRKTKHLSRRGFTIGRFVCPTQRLR